MATTVDFAQTQVITVPRADMTLVQTVPVEIRELDIDVLRSDLKDLEAGNDGMPWPDTHEHTAPKSISGVILARVVEVKEPYTLTFEDGLYNVNIVGGNSNISDRTNKNQVGVNTANSAGLQDLNSLQAASFDGVVAIDVTSGNTGTVFPVGTRAYPVNNIADAELIADERGIPVFAVASDLTLDVTDFSDGHTFVGNNPAIVLTINSGTNVTNCKFEGLTVQGTLDSNNVFDVCQILDITMFNGLLLDSSLEGTITLGGTGTAKIYDCKSGIAGGGVGQTAGIDMGGAGGTNLAVRGFEGGLNIINCSGAIDASFDINSGRVIFESSVADGTFYVRGIADVTDLSTGTAIVIDNTVTNKVDAAEEEGANIITRYDGTGTIDMNVWMTNSYETVTNPTSCSVDWRNDDGTLLFNATDSGPDAQGHFNFSQSQALDDDAIYYLVVSVTDPIGTITTHWSILSSALTTRERDQMTRSEIVYKAFLNKGVTTDIGGGQKRIDFYDDDQLTVIDSVTISADGNTRTNP